jgi:hypothetical protein
MSWATTPETSVSQGGSEVLVIGMDQIRSEMARAERAGLLAVELPILGPAMRGHLAVAIESAIEQALQERGSIPPGVAASGDLDASLSDQLYRARLVGATGLAISLGALDGLANLAGALDAEDSAVLRWWIRETAERPVRLLLHENDRYLGVYGPPVPLQGLLGTPTGVPTRGAESARRADKDPSATRGINLTPEPANNRPARPEVDTDLCQLAEVMASLFKWTPAAPDTKHDATGPSAPEPGETPAHAEAVDDLPDATGEPADPGEAPPSETNSSPAVELREPIGPEESLETPGSPAPVTLVHGDAEEKWPSWMNELEGARGPKTLGSVERMFVGSYVPLMEAIAAGVAGTEALEVARRWSASFEKSYIDAFDSLSLRGRRPNMVLDAPDLGMRLGRLHGARAVQLLLVDGMRFDLGLRVSEHLKLLLAERAVLAERWLLWAGLPTTTSVQLELIARGPEGMRRSTSPPETELPVARGRAGATPRRVKVGLRELLKLDLVQAELTDPGPPSLERLEGLARTTAEAVANHCMRLPQRTLVMLFGDHGFRLECRPDGTTHAREGGASPEEVLVPAFAWLVGNVH